MNKSITDEKLIGRKITIRLIEWEPWPPEKCELGTYSGKIVTKLLDKKVTEKAVYPAMSPSYLSGYLLILDNPIQVHGKKVQLLIISKATEELNLKSNIHPLEDLSFKKVPVQVYATEDFSLKDNVEFLIRLLKNPKEEGFEKYFNVWMRGDIGLSEDKS